MDLRERCGRVDYRSVYTGSTGHHESLPIIHPFPSSPPTTSMPAIPPHSLIVVTGITGYIASHVALAALQAGHRVRGTVRSLSQVDALKAAFAKRGVDADKLEFAIVDNLQSEPQFTQAFENADGVAHVALPGGVGSSDFPPQETIDSHLAVLRAAAKVSSVKRVVFTSSSVAVRMAPDYREEPLTDKDWDDIAVQKHDNATEEDKKSPDWSGLRYSVAKTLSEKETWKWVEENKPPFDVVAILPNANFGPILFGAPRSTVGWIHALTQGEGSLVTQIPPQWFIDVRDDGRLHVLALTTPSLGGKRIWAAAEPFGWNRILAILRKNFPHLQLPPDVPGKQGEPDPQKIENFVARDALGGYIGLEQSLVDSVLSFAS